MEVVALKCVPHVAGGSLHSMLAEFGQLPEDIIALYTRQILLGLHYLHKRHIIHRDIKGNVVCVPLVAITI